jgi:hypothetical protein
VVKLHGSGDRARAGADEVAARLRTGSLADVAGGGEGVGGGGNGVDDCKVARKDDSYGVTTEVSLSGRAGVVNMDSWCGDGDGSSFDSEDGAGEDGSTAMTKERIERRFSASTTFNSSAWQQVLAAMRVHLAGSQAVMG